MAGLGLGTLVGVLCWQRGGVDPALTATVFGAVLTASAVLSVCGPRLGLEIRTPWPAAVIALLPVMQWIPFGAAQTMLWQSWREDLTRRFAEFGVDSAASISIYPYATLQSAVVVAGCCALFVLARATTQRHGNAAVILAAALLAVASGTSILGLWQLFADSQLAADALPGAAPQAFGPFANRNHFAVLLEAGFCLALALVAHSAAVERATLVGNPRQRLAKWVCAAAAAVCLAGIVASGSRMGIIVACTAAVSGSHFLFRDQRPLCLPITLGGLLWIMVLSVPQSAGGLEKLLSDKGDPGRIAIWSDALTAAERHFPAGSGLGTFPFAFRRSEPYFSRNTVDHAHCDWLEFLVELGLAGTLILAAAIGFALRCAMRRPGRAAPAGAHRLKIGFGLGAMAILLHSTVDFPLQIPALAALLSVLLGSAVGLAGDAASARNPRPASQLASAVACGLFATAAAAVASGLPRSWNAGSLYQSGMQRLLSGEPGAADRLFQQSLAANPYSATVWQKRAEAAQMKGAQEQANELLRLATQLEPFTFRTEWPAAQAALGQKRWADAGRRLHRLARTTPDIRPAIYRAALDAGMPAVRITREIVPQDATGLWLRLLADREAWRELEHAVPHSDSQPFAASSEDLRYVFDRLFQRRRPDLMKRLWQIIHPENSRGLMALPYFLLPAARNGGVAENTRASLSSRPAEYNSDTRFAEWANDPFALGFGFQWVSHPLRGVRISLHRPPQAAPYVELDLRHPVTGEAIHLSHYLMLSPATGYILRTRVWVENPSGGEVQLQVWSANGLTGMSPPARGSRPRQIEVRFRTDSGDDVLQLRVVSKSASRREMRGRYFLGDFGLTSERTGAPAVEGTAGAVPKKL